MLDKFATWLLPHLIIADGKTTLADSRQGLSGVAGKTEEPLPGSAQARRQHDDWARATDIETRCQSVDVDALFRDLYRRLENESGDDFDASPQQAGRASLPKQRKA